MNQTYFLDDRQFYKIEDLAAYYDSPEFEQRYTYYGTDLGASYTPRQTTFKVWAPGADAVSVCLYEKGRMSEDASDRHGENETVPAPDCQRKIPLKKDEDHPGVFSVSVAGNLKNTFYTYLVERASSVEETADLYAKACGVNGYRSMVVDLRDTDPKGWNKDSYRFRKPSTDAIIWETHIRDFSIDRHSGMKYKGKYLAFTERGTTLNNDGIHPTGTAYLQQLGITHVHLMPVFDFATVNEERPQDEQYNWGYDPINWNCPEGSYSTNPEKGAVRIFEMKRMVLALHQAGIGVIMDVVYNHTYRTEDSYQQKTVPFYYYRTVGGKGEGDSESTHFANGSGCGNEIATERSMMRLYLLDSIRYWAEEYHVDGFRFDLMGLIDVQTMNEVRTMLDEIGKKNGKHYLIYGEPWAASQAALKEPAIPADMRHLADLSDDIAVFSDQTRDAIKGSAFEKTSPGFINGGLGKECAIVDAVRGQVKPGGAMRSSQTITYASSHDNFTLWDKIALTVKGDGSGFDSPEMLRLADNKLSAAIVLTSQGIPFFQSGEEFGRSKYSIGNSYNSDSRINELKWERTVVFRELKDYYEGLIRIRKSFSPFRDDTSRTAHNICICAAENQVVAYTIPGKRKGEPVMMAVCFNASCESRFVDLKAPDGVKLPTEWDILANEKTAGVQPITSVSGTRMMVYLRGVLIAASKEKIS